MLGSLKDLYLVNDDNLRSALRDVGVSKPKRWNCPCGKCGAYVLYGTGHPANDKTNKSLEHRVLWIACSVTKGPNDNIITRGIMSDEPLDALWRGWPPDKENAMTEAWSRTIESLFRSGLRATLARAQADLLPN